MPELFEKVKRLVGEGKYAVGLHAAQRLAARRIMEWQVTAGVAEGKLILEALDAEPNAKVEVRQQLPDGTEFKAVWSFLPKSGSAKLVTVHFFDRKRR